MASLSRKQTCMKVTLDGQVHMIDVTKNTTCDDVIRQVLIITGQDCSKTGEFFIYKLSSGKVKMMDKGTRILGRRRFFWTTSNAEFVIKRRVPDFAEESNNQTFDSAADDSFCNSPDFISRVRDLDERLKDQKNKLRHTYLPVTSNLYKVFNKTAGNMPTRGFLMDSENYLSRNHEQESLTLQPLCEDVMKEDTTSRQTRRKDSMLDNSMKLVFKKALKIRKQRSVSVMDIPTADRSEFDIKPTRPLQGACSLTSKRHLLMERDLTGAPLHSTPTTVSQSMSRLTGFPEDQFNQKEGKKDLLRRFLDNQETTRNFHKERRMYRSEMTINTARDQISSSSSSIVDDSNMVSAVFIQPEKVKVTTGTAKVVKLMRASSHILPTFESQEEKCRFYWDMEYESDCDSSVCSSECSLVDRSALDKAFVSDNLDEGIAVDRDFELDQVMNTSVNEDEQLESFMNTKLYDTDSDEGLSSLGDDISME